MIPLESAASVSDLNAQVQHRSDVQRFTSDQMPESPPLQRFHRNGLSRGQSQLTPSRLLTHSNVPSPHSRRECNVERSGLF